jgi:hypothetical protein
MAIEKYYATQNFIIIQLSGPWPDHGAKTFMNVKIPILILED